MEAIMDGKEADSELIKRAYDRIDAETEAHLKGEETAVDRVLNDARGGTYADFYCDPMGPVVGDQGHDPRAEKVEEPKPKKEEPVTADRLLECWYLFVMHGRLKHAGIKGGDGEGAAGADEVAVAALYVEDVPMFRETEMRAILLHKLGRKPWAFWYGQTTRSMAAARFEGFKQALKNQMEAEPFVVYMAKERALDHLEQAEAANVADIKERNERWRRGKAA